VHDYPDPPEENYTAPICPVCGNECETIYRDRDHEVVGCENCVTAYDAWEENSDE
jgi:transposase